MWFTQHLKRSLVELREDFGKLELRVSKLELTAPAVTASLLNASDQLKRMAARAERTKSPNTPELSDDPDERELDELWQETRRR